MIALHLHTPPARSWSRCCALVLVCILAAALPGCSDSGQDAAAAQAEKHESSTAGSVAGKQTADGILDAGGIRRRIIGHTVTGTMAPGSRYREYYAPNGDIRGPGYRAAWTIDTGRLCLNYDEALQADCYRVEIDGDAVRWHRGGEIQGHGTLALGNPGAY